MNAVVTLMASEVEWATAVGREQYERSKARGDFSHYRGLGILDSEQASIQAACSELALALWSGNTWNDNVDVFHTEPDVWPDLEARRIRLPHHRLPIYGHLPGETSRYSDDVLARKFVLLSGTAPTFRLLGWTFGTRGKAIGSREDHYGIGKGAWYVPQYLLWPIPPQFEDFVAPVTTDA